MDTKGETSGGVLSGPTLKMMQKVNNMNNLAELHLNQKLNHYTKARFSRLHDLDRERLDMRDFIRDLRHCESDQHPANRQYIETDSIRQEQTTVSPPRTAVRRMPDTKDTRVGQSTASSSRCRRMREGNERKNGKVVNELNFRVLMDKYGRKPWTAPGKLGQYSKVNSERGVTVDGNVKDKNEKNIDDHIVNLLKVHNTELSSDSTTESKLPAIVEKRPKSAESLSRAPSGGRWAHERVPPVNWDMVGGSLHLKRHRRQRRKSLNERISEFYSKVDKLKDSTKSSGEMTVEATTTRLREISIPGT